jgi:hypothetical protein
MKCELHYADGWAALYVDGKLDMVDSVLHSGARALALLGCPLLKDASFMLGQDGVQGVAQTVTAVNEYRAERDAAVARAELLRTQAATLLAEADSLTP